MLKRFIGGCFVFALLLSCFLSVCFAVDIAEVNDALSKADGELASAYLMVFEAEKAGANVSGLLGKLEVAGGCLASAHNAYQVGDFDGSYYYALNCSSFLDGVVSEAAALRADAEQSYEEGLFVTAGLSSFGLSLLFVFGLFVWRFLKCRYVRRVLDMKPEVVSAE